MAGNMADESPETALSESTEQALLSENPELEDAEILRCGLSTKPVKSTSRCSESSSEVCPNTAPLQLIGRGTCGTVYALPGTSRALKIGSAAHRGIWWDFHATKAAHVAAVSTEIASKIRQDLFKGLCIPIVPRAFEFLPENDVAWPGLHSRLPKDEKMPRTGFVMERIPSVSREVRQALIKRFFHSERRDAALRTASETACLVRPYFGTNTPCHVEYDSLWNFELHLDQMRQLDLDIDRLVQEIAIGLAIVHWQACLDGRDIEFVLGAPAETPLPPSRPENIDSSFEPASDSDIAFEKERASQMWILDFDKTRRFSLEDPESEILAKLIPAVHGNDPYYPNPTIDREVWELFALAYVRTTQYILCQREAEGSLRRRLLGLPIKFVDELKRKFEEQAEFESNAEQYIQFGGDSGDEQEGEGEEEDDYRDEGEDSSDEEEEEGKKEKTRPSAAATKRV
jgi:hypothetical protein